MAEISRHGTSDSATVDLVLADAQAMFSLPEPVRRWTELATKTAMGAFLAFFSLSELTHELALYRAQLRGDMVHGPQ